MSIAIKTNIIIIAVLTAIVVLIVILFFANLLHRPIRYEIERPFQGWATITFEKADCRPLRKKNIFLIIDVDKSGIGCTSSPMPKGWRYTKYVYVDRNGRQTNLPASSWSERESKMIWAGAVKTPRGGYSYSAQVFFVGTSDQLKSAWSKQPK